MEVAVKNPKIATTTTSGDNNDKGDRFSNLPEPIIHYIFSFLETIGIIRVSAVSRKWRYFWISMPYLNFDVETTWSNPLERWGLQTIDAKFKDFVNWVLLSQNWLTDIQRCRISCIYYEDDYTLHRWINILSRRNVKELDLEVSHKGAEIPRTLLSCESLVTLKLQGRHSVLKLPSSVGFMRLKSLDLTETKFTDYVLFQNFISSCPLLENLVMFACVFHDFKILDISTISLKNLTLDNDGSASKHGDGLSSCELKIACPSLVSFSYIGPLAVDFVFLDLNSLQDVFISIECFSSDPVPIERECQLYMFKILEGVRHTQNLKLSCQCLQFLYPSLGKPASTFNNLKSLKLAFILEETLLSIINLLNCSPNLEALAIHLDWYEFSGYWEIPDEAIKCLTSHLKVVELFEFQGHENELEFLRFLLRNGHVLQKVMIYTTSAVENSAVIQSQVVNLPRSSENVSVPFLRQKLPFGFYDYAGSG